MANFKPILAHLNFLFSELSPKKLTVKILSLI